MSKNKRTKFGIYYKSHGKFVGPWGGQLFSKKTVNEMKSNGELKDLKNRVLKSVVKLVPRKV